MKFVHVTELDGGGVLKVQKPQFELEKLYCNEGQVKLTTFKLKKSFLESTLSKLISGIISRSEVINKENNNHF